MYIDNINSVISSTMLIFYTISSTIYMFGTKLKKYNADNCTNRNRTNNKLKHYNYYIFKFVKITFNKAKKTIAEKC